LPCCPRSSARRPGNCHHLQPSPHRSPSKHSPQAHESHPCPRRTTQTKSARGQTLLMKTERLKGNGTHITPRTSLHDFTNPLLTQTLTQRPLLTPLHRHLLPQTHPLRERLNTPRYTFLGEPFRIVQVCKFREENFDRCGRSVRRHDAVATEPGKGVEP